jgi:alkylhydroperoxidase family enzyme
VHVLLGRAAGLTEEQLAHLRDDPLPDGLYGPDEVAIIRYSQRSTRMESIDDLTYAALADHFDTNELIELCFTVGLANLVNRFHATFRTDLDGWAEEALGGACPLDYPRGDSRRGYG